MTVPFSEKQREYLHGATRRWNIKTGATRSGKTFLDYAYVIPRRIMKCSGDGLIVLMGNTLGTINRNVLEPMRGVWGDSLVGDIRQNDNSVQLFGKKVYVLGADKRNRVASIQGSGMEYCYGDEVTTWSEDVFQMLKSRLDKPSSRFDGTCNPDNPAHWFKRFLDSDADIYHQAYTIDDNPFLPPEFVENLKREYAGSVFYDRYILGKWVRAEGIIYPMFDRNAHVAPRERIPKVHTLSFSVDVGHSNATVFLAMGRGTDDRVYVLDEYYHSGRDAGATKSPLAYARDFIAFRDRVMIEYGLNACDYVYVDPSAAGFMAQLRECGEGRVKKAKNDVLPGIQSVASAIDNGKLVVCDRCKHTIDEFFSYSWDAKASDHGEDRPIKENDHCMDALRYYIQTRYTGIRTGGKLDGW